MRKFCLGFIGATALAAGLVTGWTEGVVTITEFMAVNSKTLADENNEYSDWIEIFNTGPDSVNLEGWALTDTPNDLALWTFPSTNLPPNSFMVVFASGKNRRVPGARLHTNFQLRGEGGYLALVKPEDSEIAAEFAPQYPPQFTDVSYGVSLGRNYYFTKPTPGAPNEGGYENFVADTKFNPDRGFFDAPFDLEIATATAEATIRYTTNGSPPSLTNGFTYTGPIRIAGTTVVRAAAFRDGWQPSNIDTQTYIFVEDVIHQSPTGQPPPGWPASWGSNTRDYGMDPDVVNDARYRDTIKDDLKTIPSFSMVMELADLFGSKGIYSNASQDGRSWERKCSLELVYPDGRRGFQIDAGVRIRGGYSRSSSNPKHAFRFFFREEYGAPKLRFPVFGDKGADSFDCFDLRTSQNYSWSFEGDARGIFLRDIFSRDSQTEMGHDAERGDFYHLYINGQYWGLFNTCERPEASYGASYFGGNKDDYDVIKVAPDNGYTILATDGNIEAWKRLYNICKAGITNDTIYQRIQGRNPDGTPNPQYECLVDITNLVDYMLVILYGGNLDAPISNFLGNNNPNNWYGVRNRVGQLGFRFFAHDSEHTLLNLNESRIGPYSAGNSSITTSSPQWVWQKLWANAEFRMFVADRAHRYCFNGGALSPAACRARIQRRMAEIDRAVVAESARWGDSKRTTPLTRQDWLNNVNSMLTGFIDKRTPIVISQLKSKGLYPQIAAPSFNQHGGSIDKGFLLSITKSTGTVYFTLDGTDPRLPGGAIAPAAVSYSGAFEMNENVQIKARALDGTTNWSALNEAAFTIIQTYTNLVITEIMYNPLPAGAVDGDEFEFLELKNVDTIELDLSGVHFTSGISYAFPIGAKLAPGRSVVLVHNPTNFAARYVGVPVDGVYTGNLANGGERLTLVHATGATIFSVNYGDQPPWPLAADGSGFSLVPVDPSQNADPDNPVNWRASSMVGGSPGADDSPNNTPPVVINEILTHTDPPQVDTVELHNPTPDAVDVGGWYLTDAQSVPKRFRIPSPTVVQAGGYALFDESQFNTTPGIEPSFALSSLGEAVFLYSADTNGNLTGYAQGFSFGAAATGVTFGRHTNSVGDIQYPAQARPTLGDPNAGPVVGPVVINELLYHPLPGGAEFVELKNITDQPVGLYDPERPTNTWRLAGVGFSFPTNTEIAPKGLLLVVAGDPTVFRARYGVPAKVPIHGPTPGVLQDRGELLEVQRPDAPEIDTNGVEVVPYITVDAVRYYSRAPWPTNAAGTGLSLERLRADVYGNDPANWRASPALPSPGLENDGNRPPVVDAGPDQQVLSSVFPVTVNFQGSATDDGLPKAPGFVLGRWRQVGGPGTVGFINQSQFACTAAFPGVGTYVLRLTADDGELEASSDVVVAVNRPAAESTLIAAGARWKYWDRGTDLGRAWRDLSYDDSGWSEGNAQLGYGDGDETTVVGYGENPNEKFVTTYFRRTFSVSRAADVTSLRVNVVRDDGIVVYFNGTEVFRDNMPEGEINFGSLANTAVGGGDESAWLSKDIDPSLLRDGANILAVEIHQANITSTDISFDLQLDVSAFPNNRAPVAEAGPDQTGIVSAEVILEGSFEDDALPNPPGLASTTWSQVSGPATPAISDPNNWRTTASFPKEGAYVMRLTVDDGAIAASDEVTVTIAPPPPTGPLIESAAMLDGDPPRFRFTFAAAPAQLYEVQHRDSLGGGEWQTLLEIEAGPVAGPLVVEDPVPPGKISRYYRVVLEPTP